MKKMKNNKSKFEDFKTEELSKIQQKTVHGGDTDPTIVTGKGMG